MKKTILLVLLCLSSMVIFAHNINYEKIALHQWHIEKQNQVIEGSFNMLKNNLVYIEDAHQKLISFPISALSKTDQEFARKKYGGITQLNEQLNSKNNKNIFSEPLFNQKMLIILVLILGLSIYTFSYADKIGRAHV